MQRFMHSDFMWRWGWVGFVLMVLGLSCLVAFLLGGCATSYPYVQPAPIPSEIGWTAPVVEPLEESPAVPVVTIPERQALPSEKVFAYNEGQVYAVKVALHTPLAVQLQPDEQIDHIAQDRAVIEPGEDKSPWEIIESRSHTPVRPQVLITATKAGLFQGLTITTNRRVYLLDVRSVGVSKVRLVRFDYGQEPVTVAKVKPRLLPDLTQPQTFYGGYLIDPVHKDRVPSWTPRHVVNDQQGKTYVIFPSYITTIQAPLLRLVGSTGVEVINYRQVGTVYILDGLFNVAELRVGAGPQAELVRIYRGSSQAMRCPGDAGCPVWSERIAGR
jgi:type IV secretory pathway VirB9-like protein